MYKDKFLRYNLINGEYYEVFMGDGDKECTSSIGKKLAILYDHKVGEVTYHGSVDEVKAKVRELMDSQKKAESELGFFLTEYRYYEFEDNVTYTKNFSVFEIDVLNRIIKEKGYFSDELKEL